MLIKRISPRQNIYLSYAGADREFSSLFLALLDEGLSQDSLHRYRIKTAEDVSYGDNIADAISNFITEADFVIVLLSSAYVQSNSTMEEFQIAKQCGVLLIPVLLEPMSKIDLFPSVLSGVKSLELYDLGSKEDLEKRVSHLIKDISHKHMD